MSCQACEEAQDAVLDEGQFFIRVDNANVQLVGCPPHVAMAIDLIKKGQRVGQSG